MNASQVGLRKLFLKRDIFAVGFGLRQFFSKFPRKDTLEKNCRKPKPTFGKKSLNVLKTTSLSRPGRSLLALLLSLPLSGCLFIPKYHRPALPVPEQFPYSHTVIPSKAGIQSRATDIGWQDFFKDARLRNLIELALKNNRDYRIALLNVQQVQAQYRIIQYGLWPSFQADAPYTAQRILTGSTGRYTTSRQYEANVNTSYEVDLFGHIRSLQVQALEQYFSTQAAARAAQITLVSEVAVQYLTERALDEQLELLRQTLASIKSYADLINRSFQMGNATSLDVRLAQAQVDTALANIANYKRLRAQAQDALVLLVGQPLPESLPPPGRLEDQGFMADLSPGVSSDLLEQRPDIVEAEHNLKAANANIGVVKSFFFPSITLTASDGTATARLNKLFTSGTGVWIFAPQISLPLFNQNTNLANLRVARLEAQVEVAQYEKTIQTAFQEVSDALIARDTYNEQLKAQQALVASQQDRYTLSGARYKSGIDSYLTVLLAQQDLYNAQNALIQISVDRMTNLISLYKALGGGWKEK